ncbi:hypothetical protein GRF29_185g1449651, partial [Pseudopithomyces chartarum]
MSTTVAIAGGSTGLGRAIVEALKKDGRLTSIKENPTLSAELGVRILAADYTSVPSLTTLLDSNKVEVLISTANSLSDPTPEFNMIAAADASPPTKRFIPNAWSAIEFKDEPRFQSFPLAASRLEALAKLRESGLEWTAITPGLFMENVVSNLPSHVTVLPLMLDIAHNTAALPGDGTSKITLTYTHNIAAFIPPLLSLPTWEQHYLIQGDVRSWNEILAAAEKGKGVKFQVAYDSVEKMKGGRVTELPGHER